MSALDKAALLASRNIGTEDVEVGALGTVKVRGLSRAEALSLQGAGPVDVAAMERTLVSLAMVEPKLTEDEVAAWQDVAPAGELEPITDAIQRLSGLAVKAVKAEMQRFRS